RAACPRAATSRRPAWSAICPIAALAAPSKAPRMDISAKSSAGPEPAALGPDLQALGEFIARHRRLFVLTGAGCSTGSGIPAYRDADGQWTRSPPIEFPDFMGHALMRARYWARATVGRRRFRPPDPESVVE